MTIICKCGGIKGDPRSKRCSRCFIPSNNLGKYSKRGIIPWNIKKNPSYRSIHIWVQFHLGKPNKCSNCLVIGSRHKMHWANKSGKYLRNIDDWLRLCSKCHGRYDRENGLRKNSIIKKHNKVLDKQNKSNTSII